MTGKVGGNDHSIPTSMGQGASVDQTGDTSAQNPEDAKFKKIAALLFHDGELALLKVLKSWEKNDKGKLDQLAEMGVEELLDHAGDERLKAVDEKGSGDKEQPQTDAEEDPDAPTEQGGSASKKTVASGKSSTKGADGKGSPSTQDPKGEPSQSGSGSEEARQAQQEYEELIMKEIKQLEQIIMLEKDEIYQLQELLREKGPEAVFQKIEQKLKAVEKAEQENAALLNIDQKKRKQSIQGFIISNICQNAVEVLQLTMENLHHYDLSEKLKNALSRARDEKEDIKSEIEFNRRNEGC